jgi:nitroimidazol reductase NimA-like FMN-containing flavoprotein (pyridoxamine 5'-phosphate oxidase superfamily)/ribosomal protein S18 acetylase RimI-like enzyme
MRREIFRMERGEALELLRRAPVVRLASLTAEGEPVLRTLHGVLVDDAVCFHSAPKGEKCEALGRPAVIAAEEIVASLPSYFVDPERACPATTLYRSVQVHGTIEEVAAPADKARVLQALMERFQPEGGHAPITADDPRYRAAVAGILIARLPLARVDGKAKLAQNRKPEEVRAIVEQLWRRGLPGDARAAERVRAANPAAPDPAFLAAPPGLRLALALDERDLAAAVELVAGLYWNTDVERAVIASSHLAATAWVGARDAQGRLCATARAVSDGAKCAWIYDVAVAPPLRGRGLGRALMALLLDHPQVRGALRVRLTTRDAMAFYERLGFARLVALPGERVEMIRERGRAMIEPWGERCSTADHSARR